MKTPAQKQKDYRHRKSAKGLQEVRVYVPDGMQHRVKELEAQLLKEAKTD